MAEDLNLKSHKLLIVSHVTKSYGAAQSLEEYLKKKRVSFEIVTHPLFGYDVTNTTHRIYSCEKLTEEKTRFRYKNLDVFYYLTDFVLTLFYIINSKQRYDLYVGIDALNALAGILLRNFKKVNYVIFYTVDYSPMRFKNRLVNCIFHVIDRFCARHADVTWSVSSPICAVRARQGVQLKRNLLVPNSLDLGQVFTAKVEELSCNLIFIGHLTKTKGVRELIELLPQIIKIKPEVRLFVIGDGPYKRELKKRVSERNLEKNVKFFGYTTQHQTFEILSRGGIGVAPYTRNSDYAAYCDSLKVKTYLAFGLPVIISDVPPIALEIARKKMGEVFKSPKEMQEKIEKLLIDDKLFREYRENALKNAAEYDTNSVFTQAFKQTLVMINEGTKIVC